VSRNGRHQIRAAAQAVGLSVRALRHYAETGLVAPSRTASGIESYAEADLERLRLVRQMEALRFSHEEMRALLDANERLRTPTDEEPGAMAPATRAATPARANAVVPAERVHTTVDRPSAPTPAELVDEDLERLWSPTTSAAERATILERLARRAVLLERHCHDLREQLDEAQGLAHRIRRELRGQQRADGLHR
jgi:DNA-binding transcriptional MerR regulator